MKLTNEHTGRHKDNVKVSRIQSHAARTNVIIMTGKLLHRHPSTSSKLYDFRCTSMSRGRGLRGDSQLGSDCIRDFLKK
jgi:hypothetical protein